MTLTATCACRSASLELSGPCVAHAVCHCDNCKRRTGSAFGVSAYFRKTDIVRTTGELTLYALRTEVRGEDQQRFFCAKCGSTLYWYTSANPDFLGVAAGCLPPDALGEPSINASASRKLPWVTIPEGWRVTE